jgi:site-specific DNA recombinase
MMKKTAYLYIRVSTDEQADTGYSQRYQEETLKRYCELQGIYVKGIFFEDHSAKTFLRPEWNRILVNLKKHRGVTELILFTKWDRFSRNAGDAYGMISTLNKLGVEPQAIEQPLNLEIPENKMMLAFYLAAPEVENDRRSLNILGGMRRARKEGRWMGTAPPGYKNAIVEGKKTIIIDPVQGPIMKFVFQELSKGNLTVHSVLEFARTKGLTSRTGGPVNKSSLWSALRNPVYIGKIRVEANKHEGEMLVPALNAPLISGDLFYQVQDVLNGKRKTMRTKIKVDDNFPLRGYLVCPQCGKLLTASSSRGQAGSYFKYYHCYNSCKVRFKAALVNDAIKDELTSWKPHPAVGKLYESVLENMLAIGDKQRQDKLKQLREELTVLEAYKSRIRKLRITNELDTEDYAIEKKETDEKISSAESRLSNLVAGDQLQPLFRKAYSVLENIDVAWETKATDWKRDFLGSMFPEKLQFNGTSFRTSRVNVIAQLIFSLDAAFQEKEKGQVKEISTCPFRLTYKDTFRTPNFLHDLKSLAALAA